VRSFYPKDYSISFVFLDKVSEIKLSTSDRQYIDSLSSRPLALIICSQAYHGKARFVNELLNEHLLPESPTVTNNDIARMIRIKVETYETVSFVLSLSTIKYKLVMVDRLVKELD
jgi:hypothetical protein